MLEWIKKNRKELLLPSLCFVLGLLLSISTIQVQEQDTDIKEDRSLTSFQPKNYQNLVAGEQKAKRFQWTIEAVVNLKVRLKQSRQAGTRLETVVTKWGKAQKVRYTKTANSSKTVLVLNYVPNRQIKRRKMSLCGLNKRKTRGTA